jgi:hypothetical protein
MIKKESMGVIIENSLKEHKEVLLRCDKAFLVDRCIDHERNEIKLNKNINDLDDFFNTVLNMLKNDKALTNDTIQHIKDRKFKFLDD